MGRHGGRRSVVAVAVMVFVVGCASGGSPTTAASGRSTTLPASAATTTPDGAVPWIPTELTEADVSLTPPSIPDVDKDTPLCRGDQLTAKPFTWVTKADAEPGVDVPFDKVWGIVSVTNTSSKECRLAKQPVVTITADPGFAVRSEQGSINDEAKRRQVQMPPGEPAQLRIDWEPPVCDAPTANQSISVELPDGHGSVTVPITEPATPHCLRGDAAEGLGSALFAAPFESGRHAEMPATPKLVALTASATLPPTADRHGPLRFEVALTNPTPEAIPLEPCPAYVLELFQLGTADHEATNTNTLYRLNCVPRPQIEPGETVRFLMQTALPGTVAPGELGVTWRIVVVALGDTPRTAATTTIT